MRNGLRSYPPRNGLRSYPLRNGLKSYPLRNGPRSYPPEEWADKLPAEECAEKLPAGFDDASRVRLETRAPRRRSYGHDDASGLKPEEAVVRSTQRSSGALKRTVTHHTVRTSQKFWIQNVERCLVSECCVLRAVVSFCAAELIYANSD